MINPVLAVMAVAAVVVVAVRTLRATRPLGPAAPGGPERVSLGLLPRSTPGRWSVGLTVAFVALLLALQSRPATDPFGSELEPALAALGRLALGATAAAALIAGLVAVSNRRDRAVLVYLGMAVAVWIGLVPTIGSLFFE